MPVSSYIKEAMSSPGAGAIRKMFEEGIELKKTFGADNVFDFSIGNPDLEPPEEVLACAQRLSQCREQNFHGYMPNAGYSFAREAMAEKTQAEQGVSVGPECIVMSCGAAGALNCVFKAVVSPGDEVVVPAPFFAEYRQYVRNYGGTLVEVPAKEDFSLDVAAIASALTEKTAAVLINSPNNPTGRVYPAQDIQALAQALSLHAQRSGRTPYLVCDEPYRAIVYDGREVAPVFPAYSSSVIVTSFAKSLSLPGERLGYICVNPACPDKDELVSACIFATRVLGYVNAPAFFQRVIAETWNAKADYSLYRKRRDMLMEILDEAGIVHLVPEGAFYLWCKAPECFGGDDALFCGHLKNHLILAAPGSSFGGSGWIRLAYCVSGQAIERSRKSFIEAMKTLEESK